MNRIITRNGLSQTPLAWSCLRLVCALLVAVGIEQNLPARNTSSDSIVQIASDMASLSLVSPASLPRSGTFWLVTPGGINGVTAVPLPCPPNDPTLPIYALTPDGQQFLVDGTGGQLFPTSLATTTVSSAMVSAAAETEASVVNNLINQVQGAQAASPTTMSAMSASGSPPSFSDSASGGSGDYLTNSDASYSFNTNLLWLQITNVFNGTASANLHRATNQVYAIWSTTNLAFPFSGWPVETEVFPTNTNSMPFTVSTSGRQNLFLRAQDWTGVFANGLPCWWTWYHFHTLDLSWTNQDANGNTLGYDYTNQSDPNTITFTIAVTHTDVNTANPNLPLDIVSGIPGYAAILVNDANLADAVWQPFNGSNVVAALGADGDYTVSVGLRGFAPNATQTWETVPLIKDTVFPRLTITNPVSGTVSQTPIQFQGYASEPLNTLTYDLSNAAGTFTNQQGYLTGVVYDPNSQTDTTNYFESDSVYLASGQNLITLHATDWAGNETNVSFALNYAVNTNPPVLTIVWPPAGTAVGGSNFTLQAQVSEPTTATVMATLNGSTTPGLIEANGSVWVQNLALNPGPNTVTLLASNAFGGTTVVNLPVVRNDVGLVVNPVSADQLNQGLVTVTGSIGTGANYSVYVNAVQASVNPNGTWEADAVPVSAFGTATLSVQVYVGDPVLVASQIFNYAQPVAVVMMSYSGHQTLVPEPNASPNSPPEYDNVDWFYNTGGTLNDPDWGPLEITAATNGVAYVQDVWPFIMPWEYASISVSIPNDLSQFVSHTETHVMIEPGGLAQAGQTNLYLVLATACEFSDSDIADGGQVYGLDYFSLLGENLDGTAWGGVVGLPPQWLQINGQTLIDTGLTNLAASTGGLTGTGLSVNSDWGATVVSGRSGEPVDVTPVATRVYKNKDYTFNALAYQLNLKIFDANGNDLTLQTNTVMVGQQMNLTCQLSITNAFMTNLVFTNFQWTVPGYALTNWFISQDTHETNGYPLPLTSTNNVSVRFFWTDGATNVATASNLVVTCSATVNGAPVAAQATFNVMKPMVKISTQTSVLTLSNDVAHDTYSLCFGTYPAPGSKYVPGILFAPTYKLPDIETNQISPSFEWWQIITNYQVVVGYSSGPPTIIEITNELVSDGQQIDYGFDAHNFPFPQTDDSPSVPILDGSEIGVSLALHATMWLMFKPYGGQWVPVRSVPWYCSGSATNLGSSWSLTSSSWSTNPPDFDAGRNYPTWTNNAGAMGIGSNQ